ncbi:hypothetical protein XarzCFBP7410_13755 [Xanthomonas arboricola pv. zantedeschiae]|uniref:Uncharacterized protein n=2 Tax=Xanthomonas campestris pv. campestris TaxID=340 RepID=Q8PA80_XANCP|nr:hypothetical protein XCC1608 [Xanthomonas campestris pv. campestris str. ATCC 33913]AAY49676.1 conserved hypothetical protein [Xanthomonas campestris pv. campestris str. 8004]PPT46964.1 hypothetical protein XarjCFBP7652_15445 [Xanthomonas arboricola]PPT83060.1 hypothetical protein XarzCFBP7410_13755 [Xanthomonas arboricola pv. zantedeschiae]QCX67863.1 hypothetical protein DFG55_16805 [Xanthomonas campestris pv. campestris]QEX76549.1 hypothetical protein F6Y24_05460 [Xanthomonas arboricola p
MSQHDVGANYIIVSTKLSLLQLSDDVVLVDEQWGTM